MREKRKRKNQILLNLPCKMITNKNYTHFMHLTKKKKAESLKKKLLPNQGMHVWSNTNTNSKIKYT